MGIRCVCVLFSFLIGVQPLMASTLKIDLTQRRQDARGKRSKETLAAVMHFGLAKSNPRGMRLWDSPLITRIRRISADSFGLKKDLGVSIFGWAA